jgi:hypothetical protein
MSHIRRRACSICNVPYHNKPAQIKVIWAGFRVKNVALYGETTTGRLRSSPFEIVTDSENQPV